MDWPTWRADCEFSYSSAKHATIGQVPYIVERGYCPRSSAEIVEFATSARIDQTAKEWRGTIQCAHERARESIKAAFEYIKLRCDANCKAVNYEAKHKVNVS